MPFALVTIGLLMIVTGIQNTYAQFGAQVQADMIGGNGQRGFLVWAIALAAVGFLGYIGPLRKFSHAFMALILIAIFLANKGFFAQLQAALASGPVAPTAAQEPSTQTALTPQSSTAQLNSAIQSNQSGLFSQNASGGQAKFNGWLNYLFGLSTNSSAGTTP